MTAVDHVREDRHPPVSVLGLDIRVSLTPGTGTGPPLLLCNGIGASLDLLQPFVDELDHRIAVVRFDVPGVGGSPAPPVPYTFLALAWLVNRMMVHHLGHHTYDVLGISWGGGLAQQIAFQHRRRCRRLVLVATATGSIMVPARPNTLAKMITPRRYRDPDYARTIAAELYGGILRDDPDRARHLLQDAERLGRTRGYVFQLLAGLGWSSIPGLPFVRQPTLVVAGRDDPLIPLVNAQLMTRLLPNSTLHEYDDGHLGLVTRAPELAAVISTFLLDPA